MKYLKRMRQIVEGYTNLALNTGDRDLAYKRAHICAECTTNTDNICDDSKGGCGCYVPAKVRCKSCECPLKKW